HYSTPLTPKRAPSTAPACASPARQARHRSAPASAGPTFLPGPRRPHWLVIAERHRGPGPARRRLGEAHHRPEMVQPTDRRVARHRPALQLRGGKFLRHILEVGLRHLATSDEPAPGLRQRDAHEPAATLTPAAANGHPATTR